MKRYLRQKWKSKKEYIIGLVILCLTLLLGTSEDSILPSASSIGFFAGLLLALTLWMGAVVYVEAKGIKVKRPKNTFVEPHFILIGILWLLACAVAALFFMILLAVLPGSESLLREVDADTFIGNLVMSFTIFSVLFSPLTAYMLFIRMRYKRVVEYGTPGWRKARKKRR